MTKRPVPLRFALSLLLLFAAPRLAPGQGLEFVKAHYTKFEYKIPMRDGVKLFTSVYVPKDLGKPPYPILLNRTPYSVAPYGVDQSKPNLGPSPIFGKAGYIFAYQDVRGRWMSEGEHVNVRPMRGVGGEGIDEGTDSYDTIEWLVKNIPENNGKVGQSGISYPGFYTAASLVEPHPALVAASPQAPVTDWFVGDDFHHNGAFFLPHAFNFLANFGHPRPEPTKDDRTPFDHGTPDGYDFFLRMGPLREADAKYFKGDVAFWNELMGHATYDSWWKARNLRAHMKGIKPSVAVMTVGGWFDAENLFGALEVYKNIEASSPGTKNMLVMGPWYHGQWGGRNDPGESLGHARFDSKTADFYRESVEFPFFEHHLKGAADPKLPDAMVFQTGTNRWRRHESWPPKNLVGRDLVFAPGGKLSLDAPKLPDGDAADSFPSDPAKPVPFIENTAIGMTREYMTDDQRFASRRPDVLVYQTEPLEADLTVAGPIAPELVVSTTGTDADWVVKLIDVFPDDLAEPTPPDPSGFKRAGYQQMVRGEVFRGRFRDGFEDARAFEPGQPATVKWTMPDVYHTFRAGHRIMIQVQSSWFPLVDRNPQTFVNIYQAEPKDFQKATHKVYHSAGKSSRVKVLVEP